MRSRHLLLPLCAIALVLPGVRVGVGASAPQIAFVLNANDLGPGSFRDAIDLANNDPSITRVQFVRKFTINLQHTVYFTGAQELTISGNNSTLDGTGLPNPGDDAFAVLSSGGLTVSNLTVRNAKGEGIEVQVPFGSIGTVRIALFDVNVTDNLGHGVLVNDQENPLDVANANGSDASVDVLVVGSRFKGNGFSALDRDGLRVNEGGIGDLTITVKLSTSEDNGADGIEADERAIGDARVEMTGSILRRNGSFSSADFDDGFDIDEAGDGDVVGHITLSSANDNFEEGFDFNENNAGDLKVDMLLVEASRNAEEGIDFEEDDDESASSGGGIVTTMELVRANGNKGGDAGIKIRERASADPANTTDPGDVMVTLKDVMTSNNFVTNPVANEGGRGIFIREDGVGSMVASVTNGTSRANESHGIDFDENGAGDATIDVTNANASNNGVALALIPGAGIRADEGGAGTGAAVLTNVTLNGNASGPTTGNLLP